MRNSSLNYGKCTHCKHFDTELSLIMKALVPRCDVLKCDFEQEEENMNQNEYEAYEYCWQTGDYTDQICELCPHNHECSAGGNDED